MTRYEIPSQPKGPVRSLGSNIIYKYWPERKQWASSEDSSFPYDWEDLVSVCGPLEDYEPLYCIEVDGHSGIDTAWDGQFNHDATTKLLEQYAANLSFTIIKRYERGVELITDNTEYKIVEA